MNLAIFAICFAPTVLAIAMLWPIPFKLNRTLPPLPEARRRRPF